MPDTAPTIRDAIRIEAPPRRVFEALTRADDLKRWWPEDAESEPRVGGRLVLHWSTDNRLETRFSVFVPDREIAYPFYGEHLAFRLTPAGTGTTVAVEHRCGPDAATHVADCWRSLLPGLKALLEGAAAGAAAP